MATVTYDEAASRRADRGQPAVAAAGRALVRDRGAPAGPGRWRSVRIRPIPAPRRSPTSSRARCRRRPRWRPSPPVSGRCRAISTGSARSPRCARSRSRRKWQAGSNRSRSSPAPTVEAGAPLVQLNDAPEQADLATYQSNEKLALANLARTQQLVRRDFATQATMDQNQQALEEARAGIARSRRSSTRS